MKRTEKSKTQNELFTFECPIFYLGKKLGTFTVVSFTVVDSYRQPKVFGNFESFESF